MKLAAAALTAAVLLGAAGCSGDGITRPKLERSLGPTFSNLYADQQALLGRTPVVAASVTRFARCTRGLTSEHDRGAGPDWTCVVRFPSPDGHVEPITYEVDMRPDGCYAAQGPALVVGQQQLTDPSGRRRTNPLYAFNGCFDPV